MGSYMGARHELLEALGWIEKGRLKPTVDRTYPLKRAADATKRMLERKSFGKIVLIP